MTSVSPEAATPFWNHQHHVLCSAIYCAKAYSIASLSSVQFCACGQHITESRQINNPLSMHPVMAFELLARADCQISNLTECHVYMQCY